jgi:hypothetical protein
LHFVQDKTQHKKLKELVERQLSEKKEPEVPEKRLLGEEGHASSGRLSLYQ